MRVFIACCMVALAFGHPVHENKEDIIQKQEFKGPESHSIEKRHAEVEPYQNDCSQLTGSARQDCEEQVAGNARQKRDAQVAENARQERDAQSVDGVAHQDENVQEAFSNEGAIARQGEGGQFIYASDFGGPIAQILQHVYKSKCCSCGCDCECPEGEQSG